MSLMVNMYLEKNMDLESYNIMELIVLNKGFGKMESSKKKQMRLKMMIEF